MTSPQLPADIQAHLKSLVDGAGRKALIEASDRTTAIYRSPSINRDGSTSDRAINDATAAIAYAAVRMPATYAASVRAADLAASTIPDFAPATHLDLGAGPGTAALAARNVWPTLTTQTLVEPNPHLSALGRTLQKPDMANPDATTITWHDARLSALTDTIKPADLVTLSYVLAEISEDAIDSVLNGLRRLVAGVLLIVEPGTPAGYKRIILARRILLDMRAQLIAPCPHADACPLTDHDWCHFSIRLQRSAAHKALKSADVPFEDEPFSFLAVSFDPNIIARAPTPRVLAPPHIEKGFVDLTLCDPTGIRTTRRIPRRDKPAYKSAKNLRTGDSSPPSET